jgi:hypothetical protein
MSEKCTSNSNDWVANKRQFLIVWGLPTALMFAVWLISLPLMVIGIIWMGSLIWMGISCLRNARSCGRMHCFYSGPYFLICGAVALAIGMGWWQAVSINGLGLFLLVATPLVCVLPEVFWGTYKK